MFVKYTEGYVRQVFSDNGTCLEQRFTAGDGFTLNKWGNSIAPVKIMSEAYYSFDMKQPEDQRDA